VQIAHQVEAGRYVPSLHQHALQPLRLTGLVRAVAFDERRQLVESLA